MGHAKGQQSVWVLGAGLVQGGETAEPGRGPIRRKIGKERIRHNAPDGRRSRGSIMMEVTCAHVFTERKHDQA